jgi:hypothetical protein
MNIFIQSMDIIVARKNLGLVGRIQFDLFLCSSDDTIVNQGDFLYCTLLNTASSAAP